MPEGDPDLPSFRTAWWQRLLADASTYELTRFAVLRLLALVYLAAFLSLAWQLEPLFGARGLLPAAQFLAQERARLGGSAVWREPTIFWLGCSDATMRSACWAGVALSAAAMAGVTNAIVQAALWALYLSFVHVGQIFYGYGWEIQLVETGFLAIFLCPARSLSPLPRMPTPKGVVWLLRWLVFRVMIGSGLIKLRNDTCWRDLTCLDYHFETQPNPNPLAWWMHYAPHAVHVSGVLFTHFVELVVPWIALVFAHRPWRHAAGALTIFFQLFLIATGNLSFLNWLTIVPAIACFDDTAFSFGLRFVLPRRAAALLSRFGQMQPDKGRSRVVGVLALFIGVLSVAPVLNLASCGQSMNQSFYPLDLVNTYGAFGSVDRARYEVILEGTASETPGPSARWVEYELPCMPGDPRRRPCVVSPMQYRLDWQMWFVGNGAARGESIEDEPWLIHLVWQLLGGERLPKRLLARDPFPDAPPRWLRADIWRYAFAPGGAHDAGTWWRRERVGRFLPPLSLAHEGLRETVRAYGWPDAP
jgi:Lipase maturation factor